jgi:muramidase (phage lysozyme)
MALDRMSVEEIQQLLEEALKLQQEDIAQFGYVTKDTARRLKDAEAGIRNYTAILKQSWQNLKSSTWETVKSAGESAKGASQYNNVLKSGADHIAKKMGRDSALGKVGGALVQMAAAYVAASAKQADDLFKSYQTASRAGVTGSKGITELYGTMQKFGYGIGELGNLEQILQVNSKSLAALSGTAAQGTQAFAGLSQTIRDGELGVKLQYMGNTVESINSGIAGYLRLQTMTGEGQRQTQQELQAGAEEYLVAQEKLTKITGVAADEQQSARESALSEQRFGAYLQDLKFKAADAEARGDLETAEKLRKRHVDEQNFNIYLTSKFGKETAQGYRNIATGFRNDKTAVKFQNTYSNAVNSILNMDDIPIIADKMRNDARRNTDGGKELYKAGKAQDIYVAFAEQQRARNLQDYAKTLEQANDQMKVGDETTKSLADMAIEQRETRNNLQNMLQVGVRPVTGGFEMLAKAMSKVPGVASAVATKVTGGAGGTPGSTASQPTPVGNQAQAPGGTATPSGTNKAGTATPSGTNKAGTTAPSGTNKEGATARPAETGGGWLRELLGLPPAAGAVTKGAGTLPAIRDLIARVESENVGGYNALWGGKTADLVNMTVSEVLNLQSKMTGSTAAGRYQMLKGTLIETINALKIEPTTAKFDQTLQDKLADYLIQRRGYSDYQSGKITKEQFLHNLSKTWAGLPADSGGGTYYNNGLNKAHIDWTTALASLATGGVVSGPSGGYNATLHGTEAVVPLPEKGRGIPVNTESFKTLASDRVGMFTEQLEKFDSLMLAMQRHVDISNKILQQAS